MNRDNLLDKIRALMSKTVNNGCTEHEALSALDKARAMMDAYEVTAEDLKLTKEAAAILRNEAPDSRDPHNIKRAIAMAIAEFCDCKVWRSNKKLVFCGLPVDAEFAGWLMDTLAAFVQSELVNHLIGNLAPKGERRLIINGFVSGCCSRIGERLMALVRQSKAAASSNSRALVVVKTAVVAEKMAELGLHLRAGRRSSRRIDRDSYAAGKAAGERASFGRPVGGGRSTLIGRGA